MFFALLQIIFRKVNKFQILEVFNVLYVKYVIYKYLTY